MGYTHYFDSRVPAEVMAALLPDARKIIRTRKDILAGGLGTGRPEVTAEYIRLNGREADGDDYETFSVGSDYSGFNFCKTAHMPYDEVVTAILIRLAHHMPDNDIQSDGTWDEWLPGRELCEQLFGEAKKPAKFR